MEPFRVHVLGCGSATPTPHHFSSSQVVEVKDRLFMVDCGEGAQMQMRKMHLRFTKLSAVFITHCHGDHCFGLLPLISTFGLLGRTAPLSIYAPEMYEQMLKTQIDFFCKGLEYSIDFHPIDTTCHKVVYEDRCVTVETLPLQHRVPCCGFLFREKPSLPHIRRDMIDFYGIPLCRIDNIKNGAGWTLEDGTEIPHERLVTPPDKVRSYAYCSDTSYMPYLHVLLKDVSTIYHESTYGKDSVDNARKYNHSTAEEAALVAKDACAGKLLLGHYSARYTDETVLLNEARQVFKESYLVNEGMVVDV